MFVQLLFQTVVLGFWDTHCFLNLFKVFEQLVVFCFQLLYSMQLGVLVVLNYLLILHELIPLRFECLYLLLHAIDLFFELIKILSIATLHLCDDVLVAGDGGCHLVLELLELSLVPGCFFLLGLYLGNL